MEDRELLELAAKAYGHKCTFSSGGHCRLPGSTRRGERVWWHPLGDDTDAFRLLCAIANELSDEDMLAIAEAMVRGLESARRAIVRAAAEIGKSLEKNDEKA